MPPNPITATVTCVGHEQDARIGKNETGYLITVPSDMAASGTAYAAFVVRGHGLPIGHQNAAAYSFAHYNDHLDRLREYKAAIRMAADADIT